MPETPEIYEAEKIELEENDDVDLPAKVILFNDEFHTFDEVEEQIIKATKCSKAKAQDLTWEVHNNGKAIVYSGAMPDCLRISGILEEISLSTQIEY